MTVLFWSQGNSRRSGPEFGNAIIAALVSIVLVCPQRYTYTVDGNCASLERLVLQSIKSHGMLLIVQLPQEAESESQEISELKGFRGGPG